MSNLEIKSANVAQLMAMGDGALRARQFQLAEQIYRVALSRTTDRWRQAIYTRIGLASAPNDNSILQLKLLAELEAHNVQDAFVSPGMLTWLKTLPFANDRKFQELADKHRMLLPIPNWHWNLQTVLWAIRRVKSVPGDFVELGVFKGHTTLFCAEYEEFQDWPKQWWLVDTFDGIPDDQLAPGWEKINRDLYKGAYTFEEVRERFSAFPNIHVIPGKVPDVLEKFAPEQIAFLHLDMNNAPAELAALDALYERVPSGGIIILDDYCWATTVAQHHAEKAWFGRLGLEVLPMPTGQGVFIKP
ncbi:MAG: TylF/MycF/NovP-related O-methyltransferase [Caulobacteraceae bacterium]